MFYAMRSMVVGLFVSGLLLIGCASDANQQGSTESKTVSLYESDAAYCQALADHQAECGGMAADPAEIAACQKEVACDWKVDRPELVVGMRECQVESACNESKHECIQAVYESLSDTPTSIAYRSYCEARASECAMTTGKGFAADYCEEAITKSDAMLDQLSNCLSKPCEEISLCFYELAFATQGSCL